MKPKYKKAMKIAAAVIAAYAGSLILVLLIAWAIGGGI
jgi:hypothetical protein